MSKILSAVCKDEGCRAGQAFCNTMFRDTCTKNRNLHDKSPAYEEIWSIQIFVQDKMINKLSEMAKAENEGCFKFSVIF